MTSCLESEYRPETTKKTTEVREITPLHRDYLFHREPYMSLGEFGYLAITWTGRYLANFDYYEACADGNPDARHDAEDTMEVWANGDAPNPDKDNETLFTYRWSAHAIFYRPDNAFVLRSKDDSGTTNLLKIIAAQNPESAPTSDESVEPENMPWIRPMLTAKDLDPRAAAFFDSLEQAAEQNTGNKRSGFLTGIRRRLGL